MTDAIENTGLGHTVQVMSVHGYHARTTADYPASVGFGFPQVRLARNSCFALCCIALSALFFLFSKNVETLPDTLI